MMAEMKNLLAPMGWNNSTCGYCHSDQDTSVSFAAYAYSLTTEMYEAMINKGWRRSGSILYKPNLKTTCCPQHPIRFFPSQFKPSKQHRQVVNKFLRYLKGEWMSQLQINDPIPYSPHDSEQTPSGRRMCCCQLLSSPSSPCPYASHTGSTPPAFQLHSAFIEAHHAPSSKHTFRVFLEPASTTEHKYRLFEKYQREVHHDPPSKLSMPKFTSFLVTNPFRAGSPSVLSGSYHLLYVIDDNLVAVSVLDMLPTAVSSVYFFYDPAYMFLQLGKLSVLYESMLVATLSEPPGSWTYNLGYFIDGCPKMAYKAQFRPSQLLHPQSYTWVPVESFDTRVRYEPNQAVDETQLLDVVIYSHQYGMFQFKDIESKKARQLVVEMASLLDLRTALQIFYAF